MEAQRRLRLTRAVVVVSATAAAGLVVWALPEAIRFLPDAPPGFWAMVVAALVVDIPLFGLTNREDFRPRTTLSTAFSFAIFVVWGFGPAIVVLTVAGVVTSLGQGLLPRATVYLVSRLIIATGAAELAVLLFFPRPITEHGGGFVGSDLLVFDLLALVWLAVNFAMLAISRELTIGGGWRQNFAELRANLITTSTAVLIVSPLLTTVTSWWKLLIAAPLIAWNVLARKQARREQQLGREPVSGLLNRQGLAGGLQAITAGDLIAPGGPRPFGIILVDFEPVLNINRTLGRELYEKVVSVASRRLIQAYGEDQAARLSGEGIVILMPDLTEANALSATESAASVLLPLVEVDDIPFALDPVGGVALSPQHGRDLGTLLMKAELAAAQARRTGHRAGLYVRQTVELAERRIALLRELHAVLRDPARHPEIAVVYQPQVEIATGQLSSVEALLRWTHPEWGPIRTDDLIEAVEPSEVMHLLTRHILEVVAAQVQRWNEQGKQLRVSVNVSVQDLHEPLFLDELSELVDRRGIKPHQLIVEITERMLISDLERVSHVARALASQGAGLSLDDFGTGYASLQQLRQLPLTEVKVDRSYISGMVDNPADRAIVTSVHQLTQALDVDMVAEGVEDERTVEALARMPGVIGQGYYFGRPMSPDQLDEWRRSR